MKYKGLLSKMKSALKEKVQYWLVLDKTLQVHLNPLLGSRVSIEWTGKINCISCGKMIPKSYGQGFCYNCLMASPEASPCIMRPELCEGHLGKGRNSEWETANHIQPHAVYMAQTSAIKVGVTRLTQIPTRWIDQGAWRAIVLAEVPYRQLAGLIEVELKQFISDRTDWRKMLSNQQDDEDLKVLSQTMTSFLPPTLAPYATPDASIVELQYPVLKYPNEPKGISLEADKIAEGILTGIRGQYVILDGFRVMNMRKYSGYEITFSA